MRTDKQKPPCSEQVWSSGYWGHRPCTRNGVVERDGKWYCRQHDPEAVKRRSEERTAREWEKTRAGWAKAEAQDNRKALVRQRSCEAIEALSQLVNRVDDEMPGVWIGLKRLVDEIATERILDDLED